MSNEYVYDEEARPFVCESRFNNYMKMIRGLPHESDIELQCCLHKNTVVCFAPDDDYESLPGSCSCRFMHEDNIQGPLCPDCDREYSVMFKLKFSVIKNSHTSYSCRVCTRCLISPKGCMVNSCE